MNCKVLHKKLIFFLEKKLPENEIKQISAHIKECEACALFLADMQKTLAVIDAEKKPDTNPFLYSRVKAKLEHSTETSPAFGWVTQLKPALQAMAFSALLVLGVYTGSKIGKIREQPAETTVAQQEMIPYLNEMEAEPLETFLMD